MTILLGLPPGNAAPVVNASANQTITLPAIATLAGAANDDGLPNPPGVLTLLWTKFSGPSTVTFGNANAAGTTASFGGPGVYVLRLTANDSQRSSSADVTITVKSNTTVTLSSSGTSSVFGQSVTFTATITGSGSGSPTGTMTFQDSGANIGACALQAVAASVATCTLSSLGVGTHSMTATYSGDASFNASPASNTVSQTVNMAATSLALTTSGSPSVFGQSLTFTATISVVPPGTGTPTGTVSFLDGALTMTCSSQAVNANVATCVTAAVSAVGSPHTINATYGGDANFSTSVNSVNQVVLPPPPATAGNLSGPVVAVSGATITLLIPIITNADTVVVKANGLALPVGNLAGFSSVQTSMPATKTVYTLWASNSANGLAQLGAPVTVISAASSTGDSIPKAVYGAGSVLLDASTAFAGQVLVVGGFSDVAPYVAGALPAGTALRSAYIYNSSTSTLTLLNATLLTTARVFPRIALLASGKVLVAGGNMTGASSLFELIDTTSVSPTASAIGGDTTSRCLAPLVGPMSNNRYLLTGGTDCSNDTALDTWKTINPLSGAPTVTTGGTGFAGTHALGLARSWHTATKLTGDVVVLAGGRDALVATNTMELVTYDPATQANTTFTIISPSLQTGLSVPRFDHTATRYPAGCNTNCKVLFAGGNSASADIYTEPTGGATAGTISAASSMSAPRRGHGAVLLNPTGVAPVASGLILVVGGFDGANTLATTEFFDPGTSTFVPGPTLTMKRHQASVVTSNTAPVSRALVVGGTAATSGGVANANFLTLLEQVSVTP